jgi:hypothetical protein
MNSLTKFYDGEHYEERRRTGKVNHLKIEHPHLSIIGGTTPSYLNSFSPKEAGIKDSHRAPSSSIPESQSSHPFSEMNHQYKELEKIYLDLLHDLKVLADCMESLAWTPEAAVAISEWNRAGLPPVPEHNKLVHYNSRRLAHV